VTRRVGLRLAALTLAVGLLAAACGDDAASTTAATDTTASTTAGPTTTTNAGSTTSAPTTTTSTAPTTTALETTTTVFPGDTSTKSGTGGIGLLTGVRVGDHEDYVRIVFDFREPASPNWEIGYVPGEIHGMVDPEGGWVEGDAFLVAKFWPAGTADIREAVPVITYDGPRRIDVGVGSVVQLLVIEDFEAQLWWAIGLTGQRPFRVGTMSDPPRIFVDIAY
jgi:hypothetical protein